MKKPAYIAALILSLLITYSRGGVSTVHYCCVRRETVQSCCDTGRLKCKRIRTCDSKKGCKDEGCTAITYKLDLTKYTTGLTTSALIVDLLCGHFCYLLTPTYVDKSIEYDSLTFPPPPCPRQKLALYSTYIIQLLFLPYLILHFQ